MSSRGGVSALVIVAIAAVGVTSAEGAVSKGRFTGTTSAKDPIEFLVNSKGRVVAFTLDTVHLTCTDGDEFDTGGKTSQRDDRLQSTRGKTFKVTKRKFKIKERLNDKSAGWDATGKFNKKGSKVTGTLLLFATFDEQNQADPQGSVRCTSEKLAYTAKRR
jgi:hypothetical protein